MAKLARLALDDDQIETQRDELTAILRHVDRMQAIDTAGVEPLDHPGELVDRTREDTAGPVLCQEEVLSNAPATEGPFFAVPKVLGEGS